MSKITCLYDKNIYLVKFSNTNLKAYSVLQHFINIFYNLSFNWGASGSPDLPLNPPIINILYP